MTVPGASGQYVGRHTISVHFLNSRGSRSAGEAATSELSARQRKTGRLKASFVAGTNNWEPALAFCRECGSITTELSRRVLLNPSPTPGSGDMKVLRVERSLVTGLETSRAR